MQGKSTLVKILQNAVDRERRSAKRICILCATKLAGRVNRVELSWLIIDLIWKTKIS